MLLLGASGVSVAQIRHPEWPLRSLFMVVLCGGLAFQTLAIYMRGDLRGQFPITNPFETLQAIVWSTVALTLVLRYSLGIPLLNLFGCAISAGLGLLALMMPHWDDTTARAVGQGTPWSSFHAWVAVLGYGLFAVLTATSVMYLLQHYSLKRGWLGGLFSRLPSIRRLESFNRHVLLAGLVALSIALGMGLLNWLTHPAQVSMGKLLTAGALWAVYVLLYWMRESGRLRASQFAGGCALAFFGAVLALWPLTANPEERPPVEQVEPS